MADPLGESASEMDAAHAGPAAMPVSRRDRVRAETFREIKQTARRVLVDQGVDGLALRAVAREMGLTAPALYRYFDSREDLVEHVVADLYGELTDVLEAARDAVAPGDARRPAARDAPARSAPGRPPITPSSACCSAVRRSGCSIRRTLHGDGDRPAQLAGQRFGGVFAELVARIYLEQGFPVPADDELDPALQEQLPHLVRQAAGLAAARRHVRVPVLLDQALRDGLHGGLRPPPVRAATTRQPMFEAELRSLGEVLGVADEYRPPSGLIRSTRAAGRGPREPAWHRAAPAR